MSDCCQIIDNAWPLGFRNSWSVCWAYYPYRGAKDGAKHSECEFPMDEYLWRDDAHLTFKAHEYIGHAASRFLQGLPPRPLLGKEPLLEMQGLLL